MKITKVITGVALIVGLSACANGQLTRDGQRAAIGGAGLGAAAALTDNDVGTAVAIGAAGGALCDDVGVCY